MKKLAYAISCVIIDEYGTGEFLDRLSSPFWFQSLGCVLGYDWHSSGVTTVVTGVLKTILDPKTHGIAIAGGKGRTSRRAPEELEKIGEIFNLSTSKVQNLIRASRLTAKVDNAAVQDGYTLYHHSFIVDERGNWVVIQQGMNLSDQTARRYHWSSKKLRSFVKEPHEAILGDKFRSRVLNLTAHESEECRRVSLDLVKENPLKLKRLFKAMTPRYQAKLSKWIKERPDEREYYCEILSMPRSINWSAVKRLYELQPKNYEELLEARGVGRSTIRALALISEIIYGAPPSWKDPIKFTFAFGGKDGVPFPVDKDTMDEVYKILQSALERARLGSKDKINALNRLRIFLNNVK